MTEPLRKYHSSDVPEYSSYPAEPDRPVAEVVEFTVVSEFDALPPAPPSPYEEHARNIGHALGRLANRLDELFSPIRAQVEDKLGNIQERVADDVEIARTAAQATYADTRRKVTDVARRGVYEARARAAEMRRKASQTVEDYPVHTLAAVGVAGIAVGVGLRVWRENRG
jgi:ElaB/YqjD/DUF883 family membrane-anchored ribosome-binding protein